MQLTFTEDQLKRIDAWRDEQDDLLSPEEAVVRLVEIGLNAVPHPPARPSVGPEDEARSGPEAIDRPKREFDD